MVAVLQVEVLGRGDLRGQIGASGRFASGSIRTGPAGGNVEEKDTGGSMSSTTNFVAFSTPRGIVSAKAD